MESFSTLIICFMISKALSMWKLSGWPASVYFKSCWEDGVIIHSLDSDRQRKVKENYKEGSLCPPAAHPSRVGERAKALGLTNDLIDGGQPRAKPHLRKVKSNHVLKTVFNPRLGMATVYQVVG